MWIIFWFLETVKGGRERESVSVALATPRLFWEYLSLQKKTIMQCF
jgi:hypothetical protein